MQLDPEILVHLKHDWQELPPFEENKVEDDSWNLLIAEAKGCTKCPLHLGRKNVVFDTGNRTSPLIAFVGEGPGAEEDEQGEPFVGKAGRLLTDAITKGLGLQRSDVYICNAVKCRPPENRTPSAEEIATCLPYLERQLKLVSPKVVVVLGSAAQKSLLGKKEGISRIRGNWFEWQGVPVMPTWHPAYILRNPSAKRSFWEDLQLVMKRVGLK